MRWLRFGRRGDDQELEAIRIFTAELELDGFVAPTGQRITDILLRGEDLAFLPAGAKAAPSNWLQVAPSEILVVIPPPLPARPGWMTTSVLVEMAVEVGRYEVTGTAHLRRGEVPDAGFGKRQPFLPLTDARIRRAESTDEAGVAIVNLGAGARITRSG